eukprot:COSAG02_NODE_5654_length_4149_cov_2.412099_2_plen_326_part_00
MNADQLFWTPYAGAGAACAASECTDPLSCTTDEETICDPGEGSCPLDINCSGFWSACTSSCEVANDRTWTENTAQSGSGEACPIASDCGPGEGSCPVEEQAEPEPEPELRISTVQSTWTAPSELQSPVPSSTYMFIVAGSVLLLLGAACGVWQWKARRRNDEDKAGTQAATKTAAMPEVHPRAEERSLLVMDAEASTKPKPRIKTLAEIPVLPVTMGDIPKIQGQPRPISPPLPGRKVATVVRAAAATKRQRPSRARAVSPPGHAASRHVTPPKAAATRPASPPLQAQAAFRTHSATGTPGRLPPRHARQGRNKRPVSPPLTLLV